MNENKLTPMIKSLDKNFLSSGDIDPVKKILTLTIQSIQFEKAYDPISKKTKIAKVITFKENYKPMICNATNSKKLHDCGLTIMEEAENWVITLFVAQVEGNAHLVKYDENNKEERKVARGFVDALRVKDAFLPKEIKDKQSKELEILQADLIANLKIFIEKKPEYTIDEFEKKYGPINSLNIYTCKIANERLKKALENLNNTLNNN